MPASLLPEALLRPDGPIAATDRELAAVFAGWPLGHPDARLVQEYLTGRAAGVLDVSGRPAAGSGAEAATMGTDGNGTDGAGTDRTDGVDTPAPGSIVLDDASGALALVVALTGAGPVVAYADSIAAEESARRAVDAVEAVGSRIQRMASVQPTPGLRALAEASRSLPGPCRVILSAPKAVRVLDEYLEVLAPAAEEFLVVGRDKHMSRGLNAELAKFYDRVDVSPGRAKSRLLIASQPRRTAPTPEAPRPTPCSAVVRTRVPGVPDIRVSAFGACFGGPSADPGSELLLDAIRTHLGPGTAAKDLLAAADSLPTAAEQLAAPRSILDLGCGNGWLLAALGSLYPGAALTGVDVSRAAIASAAATCAAWTPSGPDAGSQSSGPQTTDPRSSHSYSHASDPQTTDQLTPDQHPHLLLQDATAPLPWGAGAEAIAPGTVDLVVLNPPFHTGTTIETDTARTLIHRVRALLAPGGRLVCVFNSHLRYRPGIERAFGNSAQWARDRRFTVVSAAAPA